MRQPPHRGTRPETAAALRDRLLALNQQNVPVQITASPDRETLDITRRYGDAQWLDLMRTHKMRRTHKLVLALDEHSHTARVREYWSAFDASAGPNDLRFNWTTARGMQFFEFEHRRVFGFQLDASGKPIGELSKGYTFQLARVETAHHRSHDCQRLDLATSDVERVWKSEVIAAATAPRNVR